MTSKELLTKLKAGEVCNVNEVYSEMYITYLEELELYKKALELACIDIASSHPILSSLGFDFYNDRYMKKAREQSDE